jgi:Arc/MetJ family transcription regulator
MRTNIVLNDDLMAEARAFAKGSSQRAVVEEALATFVAVKSAERRRAEYADRLREIRGRTAGLRLREPPSAILRADRDRR